MKKLFILVVLISFVSMAQDEPYYIDVVSKKNVFLYFPSPIEKGLPGNSNYIFGYDKKNAEKFGVLTAKQKGEETTLHVITKDGKVYSLIIRYNQNVKKFDHFFSVDNALGSTTQISKNTEVTGATQVMQTTEEAKKTIDSDFNNDIGVSTKTDISFSKEIVDRGSFYKKFSRKSADKNIVLKLSNIAYKGDKSFIYLTLENNSTVDYDINFIQFNKTAKKITKKSTYQSIEVKPLNNFQGFQRIKAGEVQHAVYIFEKFSIDKDKKIYVELNELKGERNVSLPISQNYINNPNN